MNHENYTQSVLKKVVNKYLDQKIPASDAGLESLIEEADHIVWEIATYIYKESGHQLDFSLIRSLIDIRIEYLKGVLDEEKRLAEQRRIDEEKRLAEQKVLAEERRIAEEKRLTEERRIAEEKRLAEERRIAEEKILAEARKAQIQRITQELVESGKESSLISTFVKIIEILINQLNMDLESVNLNLNIILNNDWYSNLLVAIKQEMSIQISNSLEDLQFPCTINELLNSFALAPEILVWKTCVHKLATLGKDVEKLTPILVKLKNIIANQLSWDLDEIELNSCVEFEEYYSLDRMELIMAIEEEFDIEIPDDQADKFETVGDIFNYVAEKVL